MKNLIPNEQKELLKKAALDSRCHAYAPYSNFWVGASLLGSDGEIHAGCNVENMSYGATICAERNAMWSAIARGDRNFLAIAVVGDTEKPILPCGMCLQVMSELMRVDALVLLGNLNGDWMELKLRDLLPYLFEF